MRCWVRAVVLLMLASPACNKTCPSGATLRGASPPRGNAQWCQRQGPLTHQLPVPGRTFASLQGMANPTAWTGGFDGPITWWHENGRVAAHGHLAIDRSGRSVAHGVWTTWHANGQRRLVGRYVMGAPVGCFGLWDEAGNARSYAPRGTRFELAPCTVVLDPEAEKLAGEPSRASGHQPALFSFSVGYLVSPGTMPMTAEELTLPEASNHHNLRVVARRRVGPLALGIAGSVLGTNSRGDWSGAAGAVATKSLRTPIDALSLELGAELGARRYQRRPRYGPEIGKTASLTVAYAGAEAALGLRVTKWIGLFAGLWLAHDLPRTWDKHYVFCDPPPCLRCPQTCYGVDATWRVGGMTYGALMQLRFIVR